MAFWVCAQWALAQDHDGSYPVSGNPYPSYVFGTSGGADTIIFQNTTLAISWTMGEIAIS